MLKKLFAIAAVLFLAACSSRMSGETTTVCTDAPSTQISIADTVVTIEGMDENILTWTERMSLGRSDYAHYFFGMELEDEEIQEIFDTLEQTMASSGMSWHLISLDDDTIVVEFVYDYEEMSTNDLNEIWEVDDFEREVTLSAAIAGLEYEAATCTTD